MLWHQEKTFDVKSYISDAELSTEYWNLQNIKTNLQKPRNIESKYYNPNSKPCNLYLSNKLKLLDDWMTPAKTS